MQLKPEISVTFNHDELGLVRKALGAMPFDAVHPLIDKIYQQMNAPHNQIEQPEAADGDDTGNA